MDDGKGGGKAARAGRSEAAEVTGSAAGREAARAGGKAGLETGVCYLCGKEGRGSAAEKDAVIRIARRARALLRLPEKHTVACAACLLECAGRRAAFEKRLWTHKALAAAFFLLVAAGAAFFGRLDASAILAGILGAAMVWLLAYASYFPSFGNAA